jgi:3-hydroxyacyl-CoA dehydrogenase
MGSGIAQVCAAAGFDVTVLEVEQKYFDKGLAGIETSRVLATPKKPR